jgi:rubrerythrin
VALLIETGREEAVAGAGAPVFLTAGAAGRGEYHCAECGYGIVTSRLLPVCPMCGSRVWEPSSSSPFTRTRV